jgi:hypothetical protein
MYGAKVWFGMVCGALLVAAVSARPAAAIEWDLEGSSSAQSQLTFDAVGTATEDIKVRGYFTSNTNGTGAFDTGLVQNWSGGVGVLANDDGGSPQHSVDNNGKDNFLLIEFDNPDYLLTAFQIGWYQSDADIEVWVGGGDLGDGFTLEDSGGLCTNACDYSDLSALGFTKVTPVFQNVVVGSWVTVNTDVTGQYVIFAGEYGEYDDYFKLSGIRGQEEIEVAEPGSMLILSSALAMLGAGALRRRWRRPAA